MRREFIIVTTVTILFCFWVYKKYWPIALIDEWRTRYKAIRDYEVDLNDYEIYDKSEGKEPFITVDFLKGKHFWHPQLAIWLEDSSGRYIKTLLVTTSTAKGLFYSGRSADNFKSFDQTKQVQEERPRRVDALSYWSHKRGIQYSDSIYSPSADNPLPDAITGPTPTNSFYFNNYDSGIYHLSAFKILVELNVAFDQNEFFSEYDFVEDSIYHNGTGLLGQPSLVYATTVRKSDVNNYYVLNPVGHGHHSGANGRLYTELHTLTTAKHIAERIVVGINEHWYDPSKSQ